MKPSSVSNLVSGSSNWYAFEYLLRVIMPVSNAATKSEAKKDLASSISTLTLSSLEMEESSFRFSVVNAGAVSEAEATRGALVNRVDAVILSLRRELATGRFATGLFVREMELSIDFISRKNEESGLDSIL